MVGAIEGALQLAVAGGHADPRHINRLAAIADALEGMPLDEIAGLYGEDHAQAAGEVLDGFSFKKFAKGIAKRAMKAMPMASKLVQFVPGVGPIASSALDIASKSAAALSKGKGGAPNRGNAFPGATAPAHGQTGRLCIPATWE